MPTTVSHTTKTVSRQVLGGATETMLLATKTAAAIVGKSFSEHGTMLAAQTALAAGEDAPPFLDLLRHYSANDRCPRGR